MKTKLISLLLLAIGMAMSLNGMSQENATVRYTYDGNGNRITRTLQFRRLEDPKGESSEEGAAKGNATEDLTEHFAAADITLFPNPTYGLFQVNVERADEEGSIQASVTTLSGIVMEERQLTEGLNGFDISRQPPGIYFLRLSCGQETCVWKIIKQ